MEVSRRTVLGFLAGLFIPLKSVIARDPHKLSVWKWQQGHAPVGLLFMCLCSVYKGRLISGCSWDRLCQGSEFVYVITLEFTGKFNDKIYSPLPQQYCDRLDKISLIVE